MPRWIDPGSTRSGFIFTHVSRGAKGFNFDLYSSRRSFNFTFFIRIQGFYADYMDVDFDRLYDKEEIRRLDLDGLRDTLALLPCCSTDESDDRAGDPLNVIVVGTRLAMRRSLLRAGWQETAANDPETAVARSHRYRGRPPDGTFHKSRPDGTERKELRLWLSPLHLKETPVWIGQISRDIGVRFTSKTITTHKIGPDVDETREYLLEDLAYAQSVEKFGHVKGVGIVPYDKPRGNLTGDPYFTDGLRIVLFVSADLVSISQIEVLELGDSPWPCP